ncbi:MAG: hypothetical protein Q7T03_01030 [Deltaproteobacteria bacterium]|nr:hypothetical protein [Deltaproteobacteria bacterium]
MFLRYIWPLPLLLFFFLSNFGWAQSKKEYCFDAIGRQCATPEKNKGNAVSPFNMATCSKVEKGKANFWISPGRIEHDNGCAQ